MSLPPAHELPQEVMFSQVSVCQHRGRGGGHPSLWSKVPSQPLVPCRFWGIPQSLVPCLFPSPVTHILDSPAPPPPTQRGPGLLPGLVTLWAVCLLRFPAGGLLVYNSDFCSLLYSCTEKDTKSKANFGIRNGRITQGSLIAQMFLLM